MPRLEKYYVFSGQLNVTILGENEQDAAIRAIMAFPDRELGDNVLVNQHGSAQCNTVSDIFLRTSDLLFKLGMGD